MKRKRHEADQNPVARVVLNFYEKVYKAEQEALQDLLDTVLADQPDGTVK